MKKVQILIASIFLVSLQLLSLHASAQSMCQRQNWHTASWQITGPKLNVLRGTRNLQRNKSVGEPQMVSRIEARVKATHGDLPDITNGRLSHIIADASIASGTDFSMLSGILQQESAFCRIRYNRTGGDSGCMQFTTAAVKELKNQFDLNSKEPAAAGVSASLKAIVHNYYKDQPNREGAFYSWLRSSTNSMRVQLRTGRNHDIDILAGAILLKVNLALTRGNYATALQYYNGSKRKERYSREVVARAMNVAYSDDDCMQDVNFARDVYGTACEVSGDSDCFVGDDPAFREELQVISTTT